MGTLYISTTGNAANSGSTDTDAASLSGTAATVAGSVVTLDGLPDLSGIITSGAAQSSIRLADATNSNQKIFWITAFDDVANTVTVSVAPTGIVSSVWRIGGRFIWLNTDIAAALRAGDKAVINNSPANHSGSAWLTCLAGGSNSAGYIRVVGATGVRPVITVTDTNIVLNANSQILWWFENLELAQQGASGNVIGGTLGRGSVIYNVKVSDGGGAGIAVSQGMVRIIGCEVSGVADGINAASSVFTYGCYVHDCSGDGIEFTSAGALFVAVANVVDTCTGRGIFSSGAPTDQSNMSCLIGNTIYGCGNSGVEITDADMVTVLINSVLQNNGNAAGESNFEYVAGNAAYVGFHAWNVLYNNSGADAPINFTVNEHVGSSEFTTDPLLVNPAAGDFRLGPGSPGARLGFPGLLLGGGSSQGYLDMGALQALRAPRLVNAGLIG